MQMIYYTKDHEWIEIDGDTGTVGISPHAIEQLGDIVFIELPEQDSDVSQGDGVAVFESVKAASDIYSPVSGTITEVNDPLADDLSSITADNAKQSWLFKIKLNNAGELDSLMDEAAYNELIAD
ncbi:MAG: glycine cleavage system protein GcvH [Candidatus Puniceispirillaceae bacterium]